MFDRAQKHPRHCAWARPGVFALLACAWQAWGQPSAPAPAAVQLLPGTVLRDGADSAAGREYRVSLAAGQVAELRLRQLGDRAPELKWSGDAGLPPLRLSAGRAALRSMSLLAERDSVWQFRIAAKSSGYTAEYELSLGPAHAVLAADRARGEAQRALALADDLRLASGSSESGGHGGQAAVAKAAAAYDAAAAAWRALGEGCGRRQVLSGLARLYFAHGDYRAVARTTSAALQLHCAVDGEPAGTADRAELMRTLGAALNYQGDFAAAATMQRRALALYRQTGDRRFQEVVLGNLSDDDVQTGQLGRALDDARSALQAAQSEDDGPGVEFARERVATVLFARGELNAALDSYEQTLEELRAGPYPLVENMAQNDLGRLYRVLGELPQAQQAYENAAAVATANDDQAALAEALRNQADIALDAERLDAAGELYAKALQLARRGGYQSIEADGLRGLGRCALRRGQWDQARDLLRQAADLALRHRDLVVQMQVGLAAGDLESAQGHWPQARADYAQVYRQARTAQFTDIQPAALASLARAALAAGDPGQARQDMARSLALVETQRTNIDNPAYRTSYLNSRRAYYGLYIDILLQLERRAPGRGYAGQALEASERARARSLQDLLLQRRLAVDPHIEGELLVAERAQEDRLSLLAYQRRRLPGRGEEEARQHLQDEIDRASAQLDELHGRIRAANPRYAELTNPPRLGLPEMQQRLLDGRTTLLEYWLDQPHSYLWLLRQGQVRVFTLPPRGEIEAAAQALLQPLVQQGEAVAAVPMEARAGLEAARQQTIERSAQALAAAVLAPLPQPLADGPVVVVADGDLAQVPFGLLDTAHDYTYLPSLQTVRWLRHGARDDGDVDDGTRRGVAVLADPVYSADDERLRAVSSGQDPRPAGAPPRSGELRRLPDSRREAERIATLAAPQPAWLALDFAASRQAALQAHWQDYAVVHFAAHALIDRQHPELSGIALSQYDAAGRPQDGLLSMNDLYNLHLPADLAVLSACESAGGRLEGEEGVFSLSRAFFYAGTRRVLGSLWPVDDRAAAAFMERFYTALLQQKQAPAAALRQAQRQMAQDPQWTAPHDWAGYVLQGDWR